MIIKVDPTKHKQINKSSTEEALLSNIRKFRQQFKIKVNNLNKNI